MNPDSIKRLVGRLFSAPSEYVETAQFSHSGDAELRCTYHRDGSDIAGGLRFHRVRAYMYRAESHCTVWHIEGAYEAVVEVEHSDWVDDLHSAEPADRQDQWKIRHFLVYVEDVGAFEVAAEGVEWLPEVVVSESGQ